MLLLEIIELGQLDLKVSTQVRVCAQACQPRHACAAQLLVLQELRASCVSSCTFVGLQQGNRVAKPARASASAPAAAA